MTTSCNHAHDAVVDGVISQRHQLINLAYRLLGSLAEAEDVAQETYARWYAMPCPRQDAIDSPGAWLTTVASRICLNLLGSARVRRERSVGEWIPEPLPDRAIGRPGTPTDPADRITLDESVSMAFLVVLESLTPAQRVVFILHDVFRYSFIEVATIVGRSPEACRQLAVSARRRAHDTKTSPTPRAQQARIVREFSRAWQAKDINAILGLLDPDQPGPGAQQHAVTVTVMAFDIAGDRIRRLWVVRNPERLRLWTAPGGTPNERNSPCRSITTRLRPKSGNTSTS